MKKKTIAAERTPEYNRFQTAVSGVRFVKTAVDAHFDPYAETARPAGRKLESLEDVPRIAVS